MDHNPYGPFAPNPNDVIACATHPIVSVAPYNSGEFHIGSLLCPCMPTPDYDLFAEDGVVLLEHHYPQ